MSGPSTYEPKTGFERWLDARLPIIRMANDTALDFPTPKNLNYWWTFGGILAVCLVIQIISGVILAMHYVNKSYGIGQLVRVGEHQGRIVRTSATSVFLEHEDGEIAIPGHDFAEQRCIRLVSSHGA